MPLLKAFRHRHLPELLSGIILAFLEAAKYFVILILRFANIAKSNPKSVELHTKIAP
jgi:hypothetical protein